METETQLERMIDILIHTMSPKMLPPPVVRLALQIARQLADGRPVAPDELDLLQGGQDEIDLQRLADMGVVELDGDGKVTGMIVTVNPTRHSFRVDGVDLHAWCAIDTLFLPAMLRKHADVESVCPVTGQTVRLSVGPYAIETAEPTTAYVSLVAPGVTKDVASCSTGVGGLTGAEGDFCSRAVFFASREAAETWLADHEGALVLPVHEAFQIAKRIWADPFLAGDRDRPTVAEAS